MPDFSEINVRIDLLYEVIVKKYIYKILPIILIKILSAAISIVGLASMPMILKILFDYDFDKADVCIAVYIFMYITAVVIGMLFEYITQSYSWKLEQKFNLLIKDDIFKVICNLDYNAFCHLKQEEYITLLTNDVKALEEYLENLVDIVQTVIQIIVYGTFLFFLDFRIAIIIILTSSLSLLLPKITGGKLSDKKRAYHEQQSSYVGNIKDILSGFDEITYETKSNIHLYNQNVLKETENRMYLFGKYKTFSNVISGLGMYILEILVVIAITIMLISKTTTIGTAIAAIGYIQSFVYPLSFLVRQINNVNEVKGIKSKILEFINQPILEKERPVKFYSTIALDNVSVNFDQFSMDGICMNFEKNKKYAIVGESGSGKSTLIKLINKNIQNYTGKILLDGKDINDLAIDGIISCIGQEEHIFDADFWKNSTVFDSYPQKKVLDLCGVIGNPILNHISHSKETAKNFSGGEKQMLSLLRMLVKNKDIILMDEPFSSIDKQNAGMLYKQILSVQEKTIIMVTHDISNEVLNLFDVVIKMEKGKVISQDHSKE